MTAEPVQVALAKAAAAVGAIPKDDVNKDQGFRYRGIERILAGVGPALHKAGVVVLPKVIDTHREEMLRGAQRNVWRLVTLTVEYQFVGPAGDSLTATVVGEGLDNADKAVSKAMTMAYKVALLQALQIADADSDADATTPPEQPAPEAGEVRPYISQENAARALARATADGLNGDDLADAVEMATEGRTSKLSEVYRSETKALKEAFEHVTDGKAS